MGLNEAQLALAVDINNQLIEKHGHLDELCICRPISGLCWECGVSKKAHFPQPSTIQSLTTNLRLPSSHDCGNLPWRLSIARKHLADESYF